jgi:hypothetical protein
MAVLASAAPVLACSVLRTPAAGQRRVGGAPLLRAPGERARAAAACGSCAVAPALRSCWLAPPRVPSAPGPGCAECATWASIGPRLTTGAAA